MPRFRLTVMPARPPVGAAPQFIISVQGRIGQPPPAHATRQNAHPIERVPAPDIVATGEIGDIPLQMLPDHLVIHAAVRPLQHGPE